MRANRHSAEERSLSVIGAVSRIPVRRLALATGVLGVVAQGLSLSGSGAADAHIAPLGALIGQQLWNAAQVGLLLLLLCMCFVHRRWWVVALSIAAIVCLPLAIYVLSPGAWVLTALLVATSAAAMKVRVPDLGATIIDVPAGGAPLFAKFEFVAFVCTLLCSMYNYQVTGTLWPHWISIYDNIDAMLGLAPNVPEMVQYLYTLGLSGVTFPAYIEVGDVAKGNVGAVVFLLIWTVLPFLYVVYFLILAKLAKDAPGTRVQQLLCLGCILHFLFLTDFVDYKFGRGLVNPLAEGFHWIERFAWRVAILLPLYQKITTGYFLRGNGLAGLALHYLVAGWAVLFAVYYVLLTDVPGFYRAALNSDFNPHQLLGLPHIGALRYNGALVLLTLLYGFMVLVMRAKRIELSINADVPNTQTPVLHQTR